VAQLIKNASEDPARICMKSFTHQYFGKNALALDIYGNAKSIQSLNAEKLVIHHKKNLNNKEIVMVVVGKINKSSAESMAKFMFSTLKPRNPISLNKFTPSKIKKNISLKHTIHREQSHLFIGFPSHSYVHKSDLYMKVLTSFLSGQSSKLFLEMRDKRGLCYTVQPIYSTSIQAGYWGIYIATSNDKKDIAIAAITELLKELQRDGLTQEEFFRTKKMMLGHNRMNIQTNEDYCSFYALPMVHNLGIDYESQKQALLESIHIQEMNRFLTTYLKQLTITVSVGKS
jgi:zinc protease